jgi:hypothetical protein
MDALRTPPAYVRFWPQANRLLIMATDEFSDIRST